ncbi:uncharacterized protein LOC117230892 [Bombus vosnesenskii]|uniref:Uncharacterized protein LOC117230892 n=2 Tax=Pyrobombus TaxID=144703 RepID=A0A6J3JVC6_9HYME|nr:uncharacterized protein LOC117209803 [Bombus bifarius]XP_033344688.1 uncharacterized protein LOC117230892 [Bombus vosnesenskii]
MRFPMTLAFILAIFCAIVMAQNDDEIVRLPGKSCKDAPPCPNGRSCMMVAPPCNSDNCDKNPVPSCGRKL